MKLNTLIQDVQYHSKFSVLYILVQMQSSRSPQEDKKKKKVLPWWLWCKKCGFNRWSGRIPYAVERLSLCATAVESVF